MRVGLLTALGALFLTAALVQASPALPEEGHNPKYGAWRKYLATYTVAKEATRFESAPARLRCSPDCTTLLVAGPGENATLLNSSSLEVLFTLKGHAKNVNDAVFSPDGKHVLTGGDDGCARLWETATGKEVANFHGHNAAVSAVVFSPDGKRCATGCVDGTILLWDVQGGKPVPVKNDFTRSKRKGKDEVISVLALAWSLDGSQICAGCTGGNTFKARTSDSPDVVSRSGSRDHWRCSRAVLTADNAHLLYLKVHGENDVSSSEVEILGFGKGTHSSSLVGESKMVDLVPDSSGGFLCAVSSSALELFELTFKSPKIDKDYITRDPIKAFASLNQPDKSFVAAAFAADGRLFSATGDGSIQVWCGKGEPPARLPTPKILPRSKRSLDFEFPERKVDELTASDSAFKEWIKFYKSMRAPKTSSARDPLVSKVSFTPEGDLFCASRRGAVLLKSGNFEVIREFNGHTDDVTDSAVSLDGRYVATASLDKTVRIFNAKTGVLLQTLTRHQGPVNVIRFSPDGTKLATGGDDSRVGIFEVETGNVLGWGKFEDKDFEARVPVRGEVTLLAWNASGDEIAAFGRGGLFTYFQSGGTRIGWWSRFIDREYVFAQYSGHLFITCLDDSSVSCNAAEKRNGERSAYLSGPFDISAMTLTSNGKFILLTTDQGKLRVYPLRIPDPADTNDELNWHRNLGYSSEIDLPEGRRIVNLAASRDARMIAGVDELGRIHVWSADIDPPKDE